MVNQTCGIKHEPIETDDDFDCFTDTFYRNFSDFGQLVNDDTKTGHDSNNINKNKPSMLYGFIDATADKALIKQKEYLWKSVKSEEKENDGKYWNMLLNYDTKKGLTMSINSDIFYSYCY